jgi:hypothetical protein
MMLFGLQPGQDSVLLTIKVAQDLCKLNRSGSLVNKNEDFLNSYASETKVN